LVGSLFHKNFRNNPLRGEDRPKYVTTPEGGPETTKTRQRAYASPLSEKRPRESSDVQESEPSDRKRPRTENIRNGTEPPPNRVERPKEETTRQASEDPDLEEGEVDD